MKNELINVGKTMTSRDIAKITCKEHFHVMRDIRDEISKLESKGVSIESKFGFIDNTNVEGITSNAHYVLSPKGILQICSRYDAVVRSKLIDKVFEQEKLLNDHNIKSLPESSITMFVNDKVEDSVISNNISSVALYKHYITYCVINKLIPTSEGVFLREIRKSLPKDRYSKNCRIDGKRYRGYKNINIIDKM